MASTFTGVGICDFPAVLAETSVQDPFARDILIWDSCIEQGVSLDGGLLGAFLLHYGRCGTRYFSLATVMGGTLCISLGE